jgi:hypothetical protein
MMQTEFNARTDQVRDYLRSLRVVERGRVQPGKAFFRTALTISASRAASFIMMYNCIEYALAQSIDLLRRDIAANASSFAVLKPYWREEIVKAHFSERLIQGVNHATLMRDFSAFAPGPTQWPDAYDRMPFSGNVDQVRIHRFLGNIGQRWTPPRTTLGGTDLDLIRRMRNDLAHGKESFENVGAAYQTKDLLEKYDRATRFMRSLLRALERYRAGQRYLH